MRVPAAALRAPQALRPRSGGGACVCVCKWGVQMGGGVQIGEKHPGKNKGGGGGKNGGRPCTAFLPGGGGWQVCKQGAQVCKAEEHLCP